MFTDRDDFNDADSECEAEACGGAVTKKCVSSAGLGGAPAGALGGARGAALRATRSFAGVEPPRAAPRRAPPALCPCGCRLRAAPPAACRTRERRTLALHVVPPKVLTHHGHSFPANQIAMFWKKDCRMFLWKGKASKDVVHADSYKM